MSHTSPPVRLAIDGGPKMREAPFPLRTPYGQQEEEFVLQAIRSQDLFAKSGTFVKQFEKEFANLYGMRYGQSCTSGTAAIHLAIGAVNPEPGDEIITAPITDPGSVSLSCSRTQFPCLPTWIPQL